MQGTDGAEIGVFEDRATGRTIVVCALDNLGKGAAGQAVQNANLALGLDETARPARLARGRSYERHRAEGLRRERRALRAAPRAARPRASSARSCPRPGPAMFTVNRVQAAPVVVSQRAPRAGRAAGGRRQLGERERGHRRARRARRARDRGRGGAAARPRRRGGARPLDRRDRRAAAARERARRRPRARPPRSAPDGGADAAEAILTTDTRHEAGRRPRRRASPSAAWRRAPG